MALGGLDTALSGLRIAQQQLDVIANNVANVHTPGYSRKILPQATVAVEGQSVGVRGMAVVRQVDMNLSRDLWTQVSATNFHGVQASYLERIQSFHGRPEDEISVAAQIAHLRDQFSALADSPEDTFLQRATIDQAALTAEKINSFAALISEMRNDAQGDINNNIQRINDLLGSIAETNKQIKFNQVSGRTTAAIEDERDKALQELSTLMDISFFTRGDGVLVVQTKQGVQLADEKAEEVFFRTSVLGATSYYPDSANGIFVGGNPDTNNNTIEITQRGIGGTIGALIELRDDILPRQQAQLDEMAHKLAMRFDAQGLRLFTDEHGNIPSNNNPVVNPPNPATPVDYVGFSSRIRVNPAIINDNTLIQQGTVPADKDVLTGSNEVIRRVLQFTFGDIEYQQAAGNVDLRASGGGTTLQDWLGLYSQNTLTGNKNVSSYASIDSFIFAAGGHFEPQPPATPVNTQFTLTFEEPRTGLGPVTVAIDLLAAQTNHPIGGTIANAADQIAAEINAQIAAAGLPAGLDASARVNQYGQLVFQSSGNITVDNALIGAMNTESMALLGLSTGTQQTTDPYFDVQVGNGPVQRIHIEPGDTEASLLAKLEYNSATNTGIPGLYADIDTTTGALTLRPGGDDSNGGPLFGGDLRLTGGPFNSAGGSGGTAAGANVLAALFGSASPVNGVGHPPFRNAQLGQGANINTGIISSTSLIDFGQKMINRQTEEFNLAAARQNDSQTFHDLLQTRLLNESGVNLEEELSNLIVMQTAFSAATRVITAIDEQFRELLNAV